MSSDIVDYYINGMSIPDISDKTQIPLSTVRNKLISAGVVLRTRKQGIALALKSGKMRSRKGIKRGPMPIETRKKLSKSNGFRVNTNGYAEHTRGEHKGKHIHRTNMETHIGRKLYENEHVHHIDGNKLNNEIDNLMLLTNSQHARLHRMLDCHTRKRDKLGRFTGENNG